jgi:SAM-dependent methyltransferase
MSDDRGENLAARQVAVEESAGGEILTGVGEKVMFGAAIFASAFLLFQVEPLIAKIILPWLGGSAEVWIVCLLFFQVVLLLGYGYAHVLTGWFQPHVQARVHAGLLLLSFLSLPILPKDMWKISGGGDPASRILLLLAATIGLPYFLLSSTSPLLQAWFARRGGRASTYSTYRFYALSNAGSMLALLSYPIFVEPYFTNSRQAIGWSIGYAAIALWCAGVALGGQNRVNAAANAGAAANASAGAEAEASAGGTSRASASIGAHATLRESTAMPDWKTQALWVALAACGSALLLAVTNHVTQNIAAVPLFWIIPLSLYLLSFILVFDRQAWYRGSLFLRLLGVSLGAMTYALSPEFAGLPMKVLIPLFCGGLFVCCMFCHGELARLKPSPEHLTRFYMMCSLGGAIGAMFVALVAPHVFRGYYELQGALAACVILVVVVNYRDKSGHDVPGRFYKARWQPASIVIVGVAVAIVASLGMTIRDENKDAILTVRNFYGVLRVIDQANPGLLPGQSYGAAASNADLRCRVLMNGSIKHGLQFLAAQRRREPTSYYARTSGVGVTLESVGQRGSLRVGVIGLGAGTIAAYGRPGDRYTFYEINPLDVEVANSEFSFLRDSPANVDVVVGDARLSLEQEAPQGFDILVVDAFSGDSIPIHLLTREAFELYFRQLKPGGLLAVHISNEYVDLEPVVEAEASWLGKKLVLITNADDHPAGIFAANWAIVGDEGALAAEPRIEDASIAPAPTNDKELWTDDYSSLFRVFKW